MSITKADFERCNWQGVIEAQEEKACHHYFTAFRQRARVAEGGGDVVAQEVFELLAFITGWLLRPDCSRNNPNEPFGENRYGIDCIGEEHLGILGDLLPDVEDPEMRARIADIVWIRGPGTHELAIAAVEAYLETARLLGEADDWSYAYDRIERAIQISLTQGRNNHLFEKAIAIAGELLNDESAKVIHLQLLDVLFHFRAGEPETCIEIAGEQAIELEVLDSWLMAARLWENAAKWAQRAGNSEKEHTAWIASGEAWVKLAEECASAEPPNYLAATAHLQTAIQVMRRTSNVRDRVDEIHGLLLEYRQRDGEGFHEYSESVDISEQVKRARNQVEGKNLYDALFTLASLSSPPRVEGLRKYADYVIKNHQLSFAFPSVTLDADGRAIFQTPSMVFADQDERELITKTEMYKLAIRFQECLAQSTVLPALHQILTEHYICYEDFLRIASQTPFVPPGREKLFARGLLAGADGDFAVAAHLLVPQVEHAIRYVLAQTGAITTSIDADGIQKEYNLNTCLEEDRFSERLCKIFGEDLVFDLQGLLVNPAGSNLRNRLAHGLVSSSEFLSLRFVYLWWLVLQLCHLPIIARIRQADPSGDR